MLDRGDVDDAAAFTAPKGADQRLLLADVGWRVLDGVVQVFAIDAEIDDGRLSQTELCELMTQVLFQILRLVIPTGAL